MGNPYVMQHILDSDLGIYLECNKLKNEEGQREGIVYSTMDQLEQFNRTIGRVYRGSRGKVWNNANLRRPELLPCITKGWK